MVHWALSELICALKDNNMKKSVSNYTSLARQSCPKISKTCAIITKLLINVLK